MRLVNVDSYEIQEFLDYEAPPYAILSHTWGLPEDEVTFQDLGSEKILEKVQSKPGFKKFDYALRQAKRDGLRWLWVDTCCVDRSNGMAVSEAINAAWAWGARSSACYAYLADTPTLNDPMSKGFMNARWFTRAWTLVELLAPTNVTFYTESWTQVGIGSLRADLGVLEAVHYITRIPREVLTGQQSPGEFSIAQRMSWASTRSTRRVEDISYSLFGLFDVQLPVLYGEGHRAFIRLQEHLFHEFPDDQSILAWTVPITSPRALNVCGLWAESPADFTNSGNIRPFAGEPGDLQARLSRKGLLTKLFIRGDIHFRDGLHLNWKDKAYEGQIASLNCGDENGQRVVLPLLQSAEDVEATGAAAVGGGHAHEAPRTYCRIAVPRLELRDRAEEEGLRRAPTRMLIRGALGIEDARFAAGGVHIQNVPPAWARDNTAASASFGYRVSEVVCYGSWARWSAHYSHIQFAAVGQVGTVTTPVVLTLASTSKTAEKRPAFSLVCGFTPEIAYCGLSHRVRDPKLADVMDVLQKGPGTHSFDYVNKAGDLAEDELRFDNHGFVVKVKMQRETLGSYVYAGSKDFRSHFLVTFAFVKVEKGSGSRRSIFK